MAPEQARGMPVDPRSDIFSFGVVLYEMLSGKKPFRGETATDTVAAILKEEPPPLPEGVPPALQGVVTQCLAKRPDQRFSSAHDLALALQAESGALIAFPAVHRAARQRRVVGLALAGVVVLVAAGVLLLKLKPAGSGARATGPPKIVVLPFENLGAPEDAYFAAGMTEEITSRLANVQGLGVISRTSAAEYTRRGKTVKEIGSELGVDYVLEGSVRWEHSQGRESRVRITPQLIRVTDDTHVWADRYDRVIADVFDMQSEVAENAVRAMGVTLLPHERTALKEISTNDLQAYDLYLRGREQARGVQVIPRVTGALQLYQAAVDRDPRFAQAVAGLAESHLSMYLFYVDRSPERLIRAREAAARAVELRPDLPETHTALGWYFYIGLVDYQRALGESSAALKIQPKNSDALALTGYVLRRQGRWAEAADALGKALELDPKNAGVLLNLGSTCVPARRYAEGDEALARAIGLDPQAGTQGDRADLHIIWHGDLERAQAIVDEARNVVGLHENAHLEWADLRLALARRDYARAIRGVEAWPRSAYDNQWWYRPISLLRGEIQMMAGQHDFARRSFEAARLELEQKVKQGPEDARFHSSLGIAYAGVGRGGDAVREAQRGYELMPPSKDAMRARWRVKDLALVYTMVGQHSEAIAQLDDLLARSGEFTPHLLRLDPRWDPLRSDPRFQALLAKYEVKP
jgi:serine/threonine-protein kinase